MQRKRTGTSLNRACLRLLAVLVALGLCTTGAIAAQDRDDDAIRQINGSIEYADATDGPADLQTVNGGVRTEAATHAGQISTVNGPIRIGADARARGAESVNGAITIGAGATIDGTVQAVNGGITLESGSRVQGDAATVNGLIRIDNAMVAGSVRTANGNILIRAGSHIQGDIRFSEGREEDGWLTRLFGFGGNGQRSRLDIGPDVTVDGDIHLYRDVDLYIDPNATTGRVIEHP